jgi:ribokinase
MMLDPAPARELSSALLRNVSYLTPNETEAAALCGRPAGDLDRSTAHAFAAELLRSGTAAVVVKLGRRGAYLLTGRGESVFQPAFDVCAVDSTAAGDAFNAGFAVALMKGLEIRSAAHYAAAAAAISVSRPGAQASMPSAREVSKFLKTAKPVAA